MPISKIGSKALIDCSVAAVDIADNSITAAKLAGSIANAKLANSSVTINSTSISLGASANINALDWQSVIVADGSTGTTGVAGRGYFINTTSAVHTFTLPVSATRGDTIAIKDYAGTFATFNLTIARNGHKIQGVENNSLINTNRASVVLVYVDVTRGWEFVTESNVADLQGPTFISATGGTITTSGNFKIHSFTGDGSFVVSQLGNPVGGPSNVDYLVVAGGGAGGSWYYGGGGGAGGYRTTFPSPGCNAGSFPIASTTYPITVGSGGAGVPSPAFGAAGNPGTPSIFSTITSTGGGAGTSSVGCGTTGQSGGSGGGAGGSGNSPTGGVGPAGAGGTGNTPPVSPPQGNNGGIAFRQSAFGGGGGGGGSSGVGGNAGSGSGGTGGNGTTNSITASPVTYAGGGGGGVYSGTAGSGGPGGGGAGSKTTPSPAAVAGTTNTGSGGGGGGSDDDSPSLGIGGAGGKGIVIIRYKFQ